MKASSLRLDKCRSINWYRYYRFQVCVALTGLDMVPYIAYQEEAFRKNNDQAKRELSVFFMMVPPIWDAEDQHRPLLNDADSFCFTMFRGQRNANRPMPGTNERFS